MDFMQKINDLRAEKTGLLAQIETVEDEAKLGEIADRMEAINTSISNYERLARESQGSAQPVDNAPQNAGKMTAEERRAKAVKDLASAARQGFKVTNAAGVATTTENGYAVPEDIEAQIYHTRAEVPSLLDEVTVKNVTAKTGRRTLRRRTGGNGFATVGEAAKYPVLGTPQYIPVNYEIEKRGGVTAATAEVVTYSDEEITADIVDWMSGESRATANRLIAATAKAKGTTAIATLDDVLKAWIGLGKAFRAVSKIVTNEDGLAWLSTLKDKNDRFLLSPNPSVPGQMQLCVGPHIIPVVDYDNDTLPSAETKAPLLIGSLKDGVVYWQKKGFSIKQSDTAVVGSGEKQLNAYEQDLVLWRGSQWDDCTTWDAEAFIYGEVDTAAAAG